MLSSSRSLLLAALVSALPLSAFAQSYSSDVEDRYRDRYESQRDLYDYARVVRVDPIIAPSRYGSRPVEQYCEYRDADDVYAAQRGGYNGDGRYDEEGPYGRGAQVGTGTGRTVATVVGGIAGAVLGSRVGGGSGQLVGTAVGTAAGGLAGRSIYDANQRNQQAQRGQVRVCDPVPVSSRTGAYDEGEVDGYDVTYEYMGRTFRTRTDHHPGDRLRVRVDVTPQPN
ncbi:MAG: glycine zipper 2TM domain-containing protein [Pseudoxanthomonas sp.]